MRHRIALLCLWVLLPCSTTVAQQETLVIDLAKGHDPITQSIAPGTYEVHIKNRIPSDTFIYTIIVEIKAEPIDALTWPVAETKKPDPDDLKPALSDMCQAAQAVLIRAYNALAEVQEEDKVESQAQALRTAMANITTSQPECPFPVELSKADADALLEKTQRTVGPFPLRQGERLEVSITRQKKDEADDTLLTWKYVFTTGPRGRWLTSFGFATIAPVLYKEQTFFSKANGNEGFVLTEETNRKKIDVVPAVFFSWLPREKEASKWTLGWTGGLGFDLSSPVIFLGGILTYNQNLSLNAGVVAHQQQHLLGKYKGDGTDVLTENLEQNQLHEKLYRVNPYVALTFRFNNNIFATSSEE